jgi:hypothetical protein
MKEAADALLRHIGRAYAKRCWRGFGGNAETHIGFQRACSQVADCGLTPWSTSN